MPEGEMSGGEVYRWASKVRIVPPRNGEDETVDIFAGKMDDGNTLYHEDEDGELTEVTAEVIEHYHADERMTEEEAVEFGIEQDGSERWDDA